MDRREKALKFIDLGGRGLEIGPSYSPLVPKSSGARIETVDHADQDTLRAKYRDWKLHEDKIAAIEPVDHLWDGGSLLDTIPDHNAYDYIIASHFIEHTVDMVSFLRDCEGLLKADGKLSLVVPDKRFCFDLFKPLTSIGDVVNALNAGNKFHTAGTLLDHQAYACQRDGAIAWDRDSREPLTAQFPNLENASEVIAAGIAQAEYLDNHHWIFTPTSFELLLHDLASLGYHSLGKVGAYPTSGFEFFLTLGRDGTWPPIDRIQTLQSIDAELAGHALGRGQNIATTDPGALDARVHQLEGELESIYASTSWRLTAPVRRVKELLVAKRRSG